MGYALGNSLSISLQFVELFMVLLSLKERARPDSVACTLPGVFMGHSDIGNKIVDVMNLKTIVLEILWFIGNVLII